MAHKNMEQNDPKSFVSSPMDRAVKGQQGQKPVGSRASAPKEVSRLGRFGASSDIKQSEPVTKDKRGE